MVLYPSMEIEICRSPGLAGQSTWPIGEYQGNERTCLKTQDGD